MSRQSKYAGMDLAQAVGVFTKTLVSKIDSGQYVSPEEVEALNSLREQAGLEPISVPEPERMEALALNGKKFEGHLLPDNKVWTNRFDIKSESSNRLYRIAQNKTKRYWACSCPAWITRRECKHLRALGLPNHEQPYEAMLKEASAKTAGAAIQIFFDRKLHPAASLQDASRQFREWIEAEGLGASDLKSRDGNVYVDGKLGPWVSYNGRVWDKPGGSKEITSSKHAADMVHSDDDLALKMEPIVDTISGEAHIDGPEAGPSNDELHANQHEENGVPVTDGGIKSPERQNMTAIKDAIETQSEMEIGKPIMRKQQEVEIAEDIRDEKAIHPEEMEVDAKPGTQIIINVGSKKTAEVIGMPKNEVLEAINLCDGDGLQIMDLGEIDRALDAGVYQIRDGEDLAAVITELNGEGFIIDDPEQVNFNAGMFWEDYSRNPVVAAKQGAEPIGGEDDDKITSGMGTGAFGGTDLEGPSFHVGFTFRGTPREASFSSFKEASAFIKTASAKFGKIAGNFTMKCPWCGGQASKDKPQDSYACLCGWNSHTSVDEMQKAAGKPKQASIKKTAIDPAKRNLVLELLSHGPKTTGEIERALGGGKYSNLSWPIMQELAKEGVVSHKQMRWHLKAAAKTAEWKGFDPSLPVQVVGDKWHEEFANFEEAKKKFPSLDPHHNTEVFTWAMRGEIGGKPASRFETWPANKMYSASLKKAAFQFRPDDWKSANDLTRSGSIASNPRILIHFSANPNEVWGTWSIDDHMLLDALAWQNSVPLGKYDEWMREHANDTVTIAVRSKEQGGEPQVMEYKLSDFPAVKKLLGQKTSSKKLALGKKAFTVETRLNADSDLANTDVMKKITTSLNTVFAEAKRKNPNGYLDQFEQQLPSLMLDIAAGMGLRMDYTPESDSYMFYDMTGAATKGKKFEDYEKEQPKESSLKTATIRITSVRRMPERGTPEWHQLQIAIDSMKMNDAMLGVMGGPDHEESERILAQYGLRWDDEDYMAGGKGVKQAGEIMANTETKEAGFNFFFPGQVLKEFYPEIQHEIVDYPNATNQSMSTENPEIVGDNQHELEGVLDEALDTNVVEMIQLPADVGEVEEVHLGADYAPTKPGGAMGIGRDGKPEVLEGVPLRKENDIRGYMFTDEFYGQYGGVPGAAINSIASKTAAEGEEAKQFAIFLKKVCGEIAATLVSAFKVTSRPLLDKVPGVGEIQLDTIEQGTQAMTMGQTSQGGRVKYLMERLNDGDIKSAINDAWAQAAVWNDNSDGGFVYEVFVRPETIDTDSLQMKYKFVCGTRE